MIAVIDYGIGNLRSVEKALQKCGFDAAIVTGSEPLVAAEGIILPGVGAFDDGMRGLDERGITDELHRQVLELGKPFLGICLGLQLLFERSEEGGRERAGLGFMAGSVRRLPAGVKVPHIGWNHAVRVAETPLYDGLPDEFATYFDHSFYVEPADEDTVIARTEYGLSFASAVARENISAVQFHPEKSSSLGLRMLTNFARGALS